MYIPDFDYYAPKSLQEALRLLADLGPKASLLAGGTDLLHKMKVGKAAPKALISLRNVPEVRGITHVPGKGLVLGALATHNELMESPLLHERYFSISDAAHQMASNQIRNLGTVGGNIANAVPSADLPPILIALNATITLASQAGSRELNLEDFFVEPASSLLKEGEILTRITIPDQPATGSRYVKFGLRRSGALAVSGAAVSVTVEGGIIKDARIVLASSAPKVIRVTAAEDHLKGKAPTPELIKEAANLVTAQVRPRDSIRGSGEYRRHLAGVLTKRALKAALETGHGHPGK